MNAPSLYAVLGVKSDASADKIKKAYRALSKKYHPDMPSGSAERFRDINRAYSVLSDPEKRAYYDKHGEPPAERPGVDPQRVRLIEILTFLFQGIVREVAARSEDIERVNIVEIARAKINADIKAVREHTKQLEKDQKRLSACVKRITLKRGEENLLAKIVGAELSGINGALVTDTENIALFGQVLAFLDDYDYDVERAEMVMYGGSNFKKVAW